MCRVFCYQRNCYIFVIGRQAALFLEIAKGCIDYFNLKHSCLGSNNKNYFIFPLLGKMPMCLYCLFSLQHLILLKVKDSISNYNCGAFSCESTSRKFCKCCQNEGHKAPERGTRNSRLHPESHL